MVSWHLFYRGLPDWGKGKCGGGLSVFCVAGVGVRGEREAPKKQKAPGTGLSVWRIRITRR
ncbi:MAG: hypothetical protein KGZ82_09490 [Bacteroidales bacterium]|nr:hypothetical protein [Bacteroidales bacterium]